MRFPFSTGDPTKDFTTSIHNLLTERTLILASNRGPVTLRQKENGEVDFQRGTGGLVTALIGVLQHAQAKWIACAQTDADRAWGQGEAPLGESDENVWMQFVTPDEAAYEGYYGVIANPLLWFLQHSMWSIFREPTIDQAMWRHWEEGYVHVNRMFAEAISQQISAEPQPALVMLQDYHLYLAPAFIRHTLRPKGKYTLAHFIHIPWPGAEDWGFLPARMREAILEGLCA
ncbi:MAG: trehalose-6-phosphate synthase, partial [Chloroflexota bacterium]|nr:trehalose-6-phosphate synthase [Chloroflexota bacterium]